MRFFSILLLLFLVPLTVVSQSKITIEDIYTGQFRSTGMNELQAMKNTNQYTILNTDRGTKSQQIDLYDYATLKKVSTLINTADFNLLADGIDSYTFSANEKMMLIAANSNQIYRHSFTADYYVYTIATKQLKKILEQAQEVTFSPDGTKVAYVKANNLFTYNLATAAVVQITSDGKKNAIINGITDWVYEEEFSFVSAFDWSADSKKLAFIKFDETLVPEFRNI